MDDLRIMDIEILARPREVERVPSTKQLNFSGADADSDTAYLGDRYRVTTMNAADVYSVTISGSEVPFELVSNTVLEVPYRPGILKMYTANIAKQSNLRLRVKDISITTGIEEELQYLVILLMGLTDGPLMSMDNIGLLDAQKLGVSESDGPGLFGVVFARVKPKFLANVSIIKDINIMNLSTSRSGGSDVQLAVDTDSSELEVRIAG